MDGRGAVAAITATLLVCGCSSGTGDSASNPGAEVSRAPTGVSGDEPTVGTATLLRVALSRPRSLVPADAYDSSTTDVLPAIFSPLYRVTGTGEIEPLVAAAPPTTVDATTWTIPVEPGWEFHNGEPVSGRSFVDAWNLAASSTDYVGGIGMRAIAGFEQVFAGEAKTLSGLRLIDPMTIEVTLVEPDSMFPVDLAGVLFAPMASRCLDDPEACETRPVGNGPFRVVEPLSESGQLALERFDRWAGPAVAAAERIEIVPASSNIEMINDLGAADLDLARLDSLGPPGASSEIVMSSVAMPALTALRFAAGDANLADPATRAAISMAIDRESLAEVAVGGAAVPAYGLAPSTVVGHQPDACGSACHFDPVAARALLATAGGIDGPLPLTYSPDFGRAEAFDLLARQLETNLGVDVEARAVDGAALSFGAGAIRDGLVQHGWNADGPLAEDLVVPWSGDHGRELGYSNPGVDGMLARARSASRFDQAVELIKQAERAVLADLPVVPLWFRSVRWGASSRLVGLEFAGGGAPRWELLTAND